MNVNRLILLGGFVGISFLFLASVVAAQSVQHVQPGQNLQAAIDAATDGSTLIVSSGSYDGPIVIKRAITVRGENDVKVVAPGHNSVLTLAGHGVTVENLVVTGSGRDLGKEDAGVLILGDNARVIRVESRLNLHGIYVRGAKNALIENCRIIGLAALEKPAVVAGAQAMLEADAMHYSSPSSQSLMGNGIHLWNASGAIIANNSIQQVRDGIYVAHTDNAIFRGNRIHDSRYGIHYMYSDDNLIQGNELWHNVAGAALMFSRNLMVRDNHLHDHSGFRAYGLLLQDLDNCTFRDNEVRSNLAGVRLQTCSSNVFEHNTIVGNLSGIILDSSSQDNAFTLNRIGPNLRQIELTGPPPPTEWSVNSKGNYWYNALPLDLSGRGVSAWPHHEVDLMAGRSEKFPVSQLLIGSMGIKTLEWALSQAPVPGMRYITDTHPLTRELSE
ncbi:MAG: right-handed parallel beta-helix repeat-containing protein [Phycisphaerales bacterium]|nr:right-handed parallel beta-helix repeat-containing protein [Phycisphaerales bacterium]